MDEIGRDGVAPVDFVRDHADWVELIEEVDLTLPGNGAIGIVHPVADGQEMELRPQGIVGESTGRGCGGCEEWTDRGARERGSGALSEKPATSRHEGKASADTLPDRQGPRPQTGRDRDLQRGLPS